jgi:integrase
MKTIQETGAWYKSIRYGRRFDQLKPRQQLQVLLDEFGDSHLHRHKMVGRATLKARAYICHQVLTTIEERGFPIKNLLNIDQRHIKAVADSWAAAKLAASTIQTRVSILKWLAAGLGKRGMIMDMSYYGIADDAVKRIYVAQADKSWSGHAVLSSEKTSDATALDEWVGNQMNLMKAFGLRVQEAVMLNPKRADHGDSLCVEAGTKGGRTRIVSIRTPEQRKVLDTAKVLAQRSPEGSMCPPDKKVKVAIRRIYYIADTLGITKEKLGVTLHGLRHQYANDRYEEISGNPSAVRGGKAIVDRALDEKARHQVTQDLGHARLNITAAYTGPRIQGRPRGPAVQQSATSPGPNLDDE